MAKRVTEEEKARMRELRADGLTYAAIGREVGFSEATARNQCCAEAREKKKAYYQTPEAKAYMKAYRQNPEYKAKQKIYRQTPEAKAKLKVYRQTTEYKAKQKTHRQTLEYKAKLKVYRQTPEYKSYHKDYRKTPEYKSYHKEYRESPENRAHMRTHQKERYHSPEGRAYYKSQEYKAMVNANRKKQYATNIQYKLGIILRSRLNDSINRNAKTGHAVRDLGCTIKQLKAHLESQFKPGMTWDNWEFDGWHIDHIKPLASFDLTDREQFLQACHYTNLQPLWAEENLSKGAKAPAEWRERQLATA